MVKRSRAASPCRAGSSGRRPSVPAALPVLAVVLASVAGAQAQPVLPFDARPVLPFDAQPVAPSDAQVLALVRGHRTAGFVTVGQSLAHAERVRPEGFRLDRARVERRAGEPFARVHICYRLRPVGRPAEPSCGIDYLVSAEPPHVEVADAFSGLGRELEAGRERFVHALDRELDLRRDPAAKVLRDMIEPFDPYDRR